MRGSRGFTLTELAVVLMIVGLLLGSLMYTLSAQTEQRNFEETRRKLEVGRELLLSFAIVNGRLPCPAICTNPPICGAAESGVEASPGGGVCTNSFGGFLPATTIGYQQVNSKGFALDAWGNPIRYAVSAATPVNSQIPRICRPVNDTTPPVTPHFTNATNLKANGIDCQPNDLVVCKSSTGITATTCGPATNALTNQTVVVALVFSTGKNGALACATCTDEAANTNGDQVFVFHTPAPSTAAGGEFDDQLLWIPVGELYARLVAAGVLP